MSKFAPMILIIDDDRAVCLSLELLLKRAGYEVTSVNTQADAIDYVRGNSPQLVLMDMNFSRSTSGDEGLILLRQVKLFRPAVPVILMTAWGSIPLAVQGIQAGASDFITKPWNNQLLLQRISTLLDIAGREDEGESAVDSDGFDRSFIIGNSPELIAVLDTIKRVAKTDASVLIMGENGTGKELIAQALHVNSRRKSKPFVKVNLGGVSHSLFESEMFGHKKGAFTGATADREGRFSVADKGTIFLDEIGDLDMSCQVKLLRVLQEHIPRRPFLPHKSYYRDAASAEGAPKRHSAPRAILCRRDMPPQRHAAGEDSQDGDELSVEVALSRQHSRT